MKPFLLETKLQIPPQPHRAVRRARLVDVLERGIRHYKLLLLSAPAGYGKTTLLSQWAQASHLPVVWLSLSQEDNDLERFFRYLLAGWEAVQPGVREGPLSLLLGAMSPDSEAILAAFINAANDAPDPIAFVLDDYHLIEDASIHEALTFLLDHLPPTLHVVLAGRGESPLPLARYRAHHELMEFRAGDLSFRPEETQAFLNEMMGLDLAQDDVDRLHRQLEGWIAGLQLVALSLQQRLTGADKLVVSGRHRFIADYLSDDVLAPLPDDLRHFMLRTSILDRLCGSLCDAVTGQENGQAMLETLERENLFLVPLDDRREWFRYHRLFADFLHETLKRRHPDEVADLHRRAAGWYLDRDLPEPAFDHAIATLDGDIVAQIADRYFEMMFHVRELNLLKRWLDAVPAEWHFDYPVIGLNHAAWLAITGSLDACLDHVDAIEQHLIQAEREDKHWQLARVNTIRCQLACLQGGLTQAEPYAARALSDLPKTDHHYRANVHIALGDTYRNVGRWEEARRNYRRLLELTHDPEYHIRSIHVQSALADLELRQGRLRKALALWRKALSGIKAQDTWGRLPLRLIGWVYIRLGELLYEWNELAEAWEHVSQGLERARPHVESARFSHWLSRFERFNWSSGWHRTGCGSRLIGPMRCCVTLPLGNGLKARSLNWPWLAC